MSLPTVGTLILAVGNGATKRVRSDAKNTLGLGRAFGHQVASAMRMLDMSLK